MRFRSLAVFVVFAALATAAPVAAQTGSIEVRLIPLSAEPVPQGERFHFSVAIENTTSEAEFVTVSLDVAPVGQEDKLVAFDRWSTSVPAGKTVTTERTVVTSQWFRPTGDFKIFGRSFYTVPPLRFEVGPAQRVVPVFDNVTAEVGLFTDHGYSLRCDSYAAGAAWGDAEGDGDLDLYLPHQTKPSQLFLNQDGHFTEAPGANGADNGGSPGIGANFIDYDNDGDQDLYVVNRGPNRLYQNDGTGQFADVAPAAGVDQSGPGSSASWTDYDNDGFVDLYVTNWTDCSGAPSSRTYVYADDALYRNRGDGTFEDRTVDLHRTGTTNGAGFQASWFDYDNDGDQDLFLGNDYAGPAPKPNVFWRNDGPGPDGSWIFTNVSEETGTGLANNTMGVGVGDYDNDLDLDFVLSNIGRNFLMRNEGDGSFSDVGEASGVSRQFQKSQDVSITWGLAFADFNNDRLEDIYMAAGSLGNFHTFEPQMNALMVGKGGGKFIDLSGPSRANDEQVGRGVSFADFDVDGRMDVYVVNQGGNPILFRNVTDPGRRRWLEVDTIGTVSNSDGCGARVTAVTWKGLRSIRQVFCGSVGLAGGSDSTVHFGLKRAKSLKSVIVEWPSGIRQRRRDVATNRLLTFTEPTS